MTDRGINERLADALGIPRGGYGFHGPRVQDDDGFWTIHFTPATSVDDLRKWVLPEIQRRKLVVEFFMAAGYTYDEAMGSDSSRWDGFMRILSLPPSTLAAAALAVMEEDNV